ncbi:hypothetical protein [Natrinema hispanicum]|uniref:hypothetical protein n=1 Tax=Natrinema hispanicum TaxID=392421 RepID=UPI00122D2071|nr:hypothetical protein [Natrinema hispanicum]
MNHYAPRYSPVGRARAGVPLVAGLLIGYSVAHYIVNNYNGDDVTSDYLSSRAFEDHLNFYNEAREIHEVTDAELLASLERDANNLADTAREDAIMKMYEAVATGASRSEAKTQAQNVIDARFTAPEKALATRVNSISQFLLESYNFESQHGKEISVAMMSDGTELSAGGTYVKSKTYTFLDGSTAEVDYLGGTVAQGPYWDPFGIGSEPDTNSARELVIKPPDPANYNNVNADDYDLSHVNGNQTVVTHSDYKSVVTAIHDAHSAVMNEVESLLSIHYDNISAGDLSLDEMLSTGAMLDVVAEATSWQDAALYFRSLGVPEAVEPGRISIDPADVESVQDSDGNTTNTTDSTTDLPDEPQSFDGKIAWSLSTEVEGNELPVGAKIDPETYPGDFYAAVEWQDVDGNMQADVLHLVDPFTIEGVNSGSDVLKFEQRDVVTSDTSPDKAKDIFKQNRESEEQARKQTTEVVLEDDGPGPLFSGDILGGSGGQLLGLGIIGVAILAVVGFVTDALPGTGN